MEVPGLVVGEQTSNLLFDEVVELETAWVCFGPLSSAVHARVKKRRTFNKQSGM